MATREETKRMIEVMQAYVDGKEIEAASIGGNDWSEPYETPKWNFREMKYRIADPYAELKAAAKDLMKQIRVKDNNTGWCRWWDAPTYPWAFCAPPENYEIRDKPKTRKVKLLAGFTGTKLEWASSGAFHPSWKRVPKEDKEVEIEE